MFLPATLHICAKGEHVPIIERSVRTVKRWLNIFPSTSDGGSAPRPAMVIEGRDYSGAQNKRIAFGKYAMVHAGTKNDLSPRTEPCIALRDSYHNGGHYFMSLKTGKRIHGNKWSEVPIKKDVINIVHELASVPKQHWSSDSPLSFESEPGVKINEDIQIYNESSYNHDTISHGNVEIDDRIRAATNNLNKIESVEDPPADEPTDDSDSTFVSSEDSTDDSVMNKDPARDI